MLISKEQHWRSPAKKLEEQSITKLQGCQEKARGKGKTKTYLNKPSLLLKRMILGEQENGFLDIICIEVVYHLQESCPYLVIFAPIKDFLDVYYVSTWPNVKYLKTSEILKVSSNFDIHSFVQISRNLGVCAS